MIRSDVIVVGGGPAGSVAAHRLAKEGVKVTLLDRTTFPRDKSCGDGVGARGLAVLERSGLGEWSKQFLAPEVLRMSPPDGRILEVKPPADNGYCFGRTMKRIEMDSMLIQTAVKDGAQLFENTRVEHVDCNADDVLVSSNGTKFSAEVLILADGSHAPVTRRLGLVKRAPDLYAIRQYYHGDADTSKVIEFHFQKWLVPGYTWIFPMNDGYANVGTGTFSYRLKDKDVDLRSFLERFLAEQRTACKRLAQAKPDGGIKGHPLRSDLGRERTHAHRVMVAGDAAGLVNPLSGEGISSGMESGELAARHAVEALRVGDFSVARLSGYTRELLRMFAPDWRAARLFRQVLKMPQLLNHIFRRMEREPQRALLFGYLLLNHMPQRELLNPKVLLRLLG